MYIVYIPIPETSVLVESNSLKGAVNVPPPMTIYGLPCYSP